MELGERLRRARLAAGLSQRQLVGDRITRNMLSQIEHGTAAPSMETLRYLAERLGRPVSYFLDQGEADFLERAWSSFDSGDDAGALQLLEQLREQTRESRLLKSLALLRLAQISAEQGRDVYARKLLDQAQELEGEIPWLPELKIRRLQISARLHLAVDPAALPSLDQQLYLHAYVCMRSDAPEQAAAYLDACQDRTASPWRLLRARTYMAQREYTPAAQLLRQEEKRCPEEAIPLLEQCFRELGDFQQAYHYACLQRK